jgi:hypothetical protein
LSDLLVEIVDTLETYGLSRYLSDGTPAVDWNSLELRGQQANGDEFPIEVNFGEYAVDGEHLFTGVIRDISSRKETGSQLQDHTSKVTELHELATEIITAETTDAIYERTVTGAVDLFDADIARVAVATGDQLEPAASSAPGDSVRDCDPISITVGFAGQSYQSNAVLRVDDIADTRSTTTSLSQDGGAQPYPQPEPRALSNIHSQSTECFRCSLPSRMRSPSVMKRSEKCLPPTS